MKFAQNVLAAAVLVAAAVLIYHSFSSRTLETRLGTSERRIDVVEKGSRDQGQVLEVQRKEIGAQGEKLKGQREDMVQVKQRLAAAEARLAELARAAEGDRTDLLKLRSALKDLEARSVEEERQRLALEDAGREIKKGVQRDQEIERRLLLIEKHLGIARPQP